MTYQKVRPETQERRTFFIFTRHETIRFYGKNQLNLPLLPTNCSLSQQQINYFIIKREKI